MTQSIDSELWQDFQEEMAKGIEKVKGKARIKNSEPPATDWMRAVTEKLRISELASEYGVDKCPICNYDIYFDDLRGWFICATQKWKNEKCFAGNIVDFVREVMIK